MRRTLTNAAARARRRRRLGLGLALAALVSITALAAVAGEVPRFVSVRTDKANVRAGPGVQYPVEWVLLQRALPLQVVAEFGHWRKVRDRQGILGWIHKSLLSSRRTVLIVDDIQALRATPAADGIVLLQAEPGVQGTLRGCRAGWCRIEVAGRVGWAPEDALWGTEAPPPQAAR